MAEEEVEDVASYVRARMPGMSTATAPHKDEEEEREDGEDGAGTLTGPLVREAKKRKASPLEGDAFARSLRSFRAAGMLTSGSHGSGAAADSHTSHTSCAASGASSAESRLQDLARSYNEIATRELGQPLSRAATASAAAAASTRSRRDGDPDGVDDDDEDDFEDCPPIAAVTKTVH